MTVEELEIAPARGPLHAAIGLPGSKSITNRALLLAAMASGQSTIEAALLSDDTGAMTDALRALGFRVEVDEAAHRISVHGLGGAIPASSAELFVDGGFAQVRNNVVTVLTQRAIAADQIDTTAAATSPLVPIVPHSG